MHIPLFSVLGRTALRRLFSYFCIALSTIYYCFTVGEPSEDDDESQPAGKEIC